MVFMITHIFTFARSVQDLMYFQIERSEKGTHTNEKMMLKMFYLHVEWILQSEKKQKLSSVQKITCITAIADKKIRRSLSLSVVLCSPFKSAVQIK